MPALGGPADSFSLEVKVAEKRSAIVENALSILGELVKANAVVGNSLVARDILKSLGLTEDEFWAADIYLKQGRYVVGTLGGLDGSRWLTAAGIDFYENNQYSAPSIHIGAIIQGSVENSQIQAIASAVDSTIQQVVDQASSEDIRNAISAIAEEMVQAVKADLNLEELAAYVKSAKQLQEEAEKETPDKSTLHRLVSGMSFLSNLEGTIAFGDRALRLAERVLPYLPMLIAYLNKLQ